MGTSLNRFAKLDEKVRKLTERSALRRDTHARACAAFGLAGVLTNLTNLMRQSNVALDNFPANRDVSRRFVELALSDASLTPTLGFLADVGKSST